MHYNTVLEYSIISYAVYNIHHGPSVYVTQTYITHSTPVLTSPCIRVHAVKHIVLIIGLHA